jgi:hypothetical protein
MFLSGKGSPSFAIIPSQKYCFSSPFHAVLLFIFLFMLTLTPSGYGLDDRAIEVQFPAKTKGFFL